VPLDRNQIGKCWHSAKQSVLWNRLFAAKGAALPRTVGLTIKILGHLVNVGPVKEFHVDRRLASLELSDEKQ
jgi:hypothetical protein